MVPDRTPIDPGSGGNSPPPGDPNDHPTDGGDSNDPRPHSFPWHVSRVLDRIDAILPFALVPLLTSLSQIASVRRALDPAGGISVNFKFVFPSPFLDLWTLVDPPARVDRHAIGSGSSPRDDPFADPTVPTGSADATGPGGTDLTVDTPLYGVGIPIEDVGVATGVWIAIALLAYAAIAAVLAAVYVGGLDRRLRGESVAAAACVREYAPRFFLYGLVTFGGVLVLVPFAMLSPIVILLALPALVVLGYLFYAAPFLFIVADAPFLDAFRRSYGFAIRGGAYLGFALWHVVVAVVSSIVLSLLVSVGPVGFPFALLLAVPLSLVLTAAAVSFVRELSNAKTKGDRRRTRP
ncbi:hypothetical protein [Halosolutus gelatinilyticus]|uniref:hypothetical protein n=1 Tax=Halosolutus gelatinilyticus TaxID=2931975 RepID=UPI001FF1EE29|nr:hypothetical protein [Halosolutus gelatinilyticus]